MKIVPTHIATGLNDFSIRVPERGEAASPQRGERGQLFKGKPLWPQYNRYRDETNFQGYFSVKLVERVSRISRGAPTFERMFSRCVPTCDPKSTYVEAAEACVRPATTATGWATIGVMQVIQGASSDCTGARKQALHVCMYIHVTRASKDRRRRVRAVVA